MSEFDKWLKGSRYSIQGNFTELTEVLTDAFNAGRELQRELDAQVSSEYNPNGSWGKIIAKAIREQDIND